LAKFADAGANGCTVHIEVEGTSELIAEMRRLELDVGLAVNPETSFDAAEPFLGAVDLLLLMTVHPGFGGQTFMDEVMPKVAQARREIDRRGLRVALQVDGGINEATAPTAAAAGADTFVAGYAIFGAVDALDAARRLRAAIG
jgi:ribulose-phosphate 3-epimerase